MKLITDVARAICLIRVTLVSSFIGRRTSDPTRGIRSSAVNIAVEKEIEP
jgi:hypothetical protein